MSRYIDAEWLKELYKPYASFNGKEYSVPIGAILANIDDAPTIDIVRCGECKYWKSTVQMPNGTEVKCLYGRKADDFCSYGEREEEDIPMEYFENGGI